MQYADGTSLEYHQPFGLTCWGKALCPDGKIRAFTGGCADTFFSVPARVKAKGTTVTGYITVTTKSGSSVPTDDDPAIVKFVPYLYRKNHALVS